MAEYRVLLAQLVNAELISAENDTFVNARLYYVFEHGKYGELLNFFVFTGEQDTMFINGYEFEFNSIFFEMVLPFLPEDAVETITTYVNAVERTNHGKPRGR